MKSLSVPDELGGIIEAIIEFYQDAVAQLDSAIVFQELKTNLINWVAKTSEQIEQQKSQQTGLTQDQRLAYDTIIDFIHSDEQYFRLSGYAGTGKTHLIVKVIQWLQQRELKYTVAAPTNKAAKNLTQLARNQGLNLEATTVAKLLKLQPVIDVNTGQQLFEFIQEKELELTDYDVIILDEYSMLSKENFQDLQKAIYGSDTQIIFVGDSQQLPPVKEKEPIVARHPDIKRSSNLTQVVRYDGEIRKGWVRISHN